MSQIATDSIEAAISRTGNTHPSPVNTLKLELTEREEKIILFALRQFVRDAYAHLNAAAQDKSNTIYPPGAVEAFWKDVRDAEALLTRMRGGQRKSEADPCPQCAHCATDNAGGRQYDTACWECCHFYSSQFEQRK